MSWRAVIIGVLLGLAIASLTYFNDHVIRQTHLVSSHLPPSVFGTLVMVLLLLNPLTGRLFGRGPLGPGEIAVIAALSLSVCGYPGSGFFRFFTNNVTMPAHMAQAQPAWQSVEIMSYIPGGSPRLGDGHLQDGQTLARRLTEARPADSVEAALWQRLSPRERRDLQAMADQAQALTPEQRRQVRQALNRVIDEPSVSTRRPPFYEQFNRELLSAASHALLEKHRRLLERAEAMEADLAELRSTRERRVAAPEASPEAEAGLPRPIRELDREIAGQHQWLAYLDREAERTQRRLNRQALADLLPEHVLPPPRGRGIVATGGEPDRLVLGPLLEGGDGSAGIPWSVLWPSIALWGGVAVLLGLASLGLVLVVHPQWSRGELLPYPIIRFLTEMSQPSERGWLPAVARQKLFWLGLLGIGLIHTNNGIYTWFPQWVEIPLSFDFTPLQELLPYAARAGWGPHQLWEPRLFPSMIAFAFFLSRQVSLSVGLAGFVYMAFVAMLLRRGVTVSGSELTSPMLFGGFAGMTLMILYIGRHHYLNVALAATGLRLARSHTPTYSIWGARLLTASTLAAVWLLWHGGLHWIWGVALVGCVLMMFLVICRMNVEAGTFFIISGWFPAGVLASLLGVEAIGPTAFIVLAIASVVLVGDPRETVMAFLANGFRAVDTQRGVRRGRLVMGMMAMLVAGFLVALVVTLTLQYNLGVNLQDQWTTRGLPAMPYNWTTRHLSEMHADGQLATVTAQDSLSRLFSARPQAGPLGWAAVGALLVIGCWIARLRLPWWPLHPLLFVIWGNYVAFGIAASFLVGWLIKSTVVAVGGHRGDTTIKPLMIGIVAGELLAVLGWALVGAIYYFYTGITPERYAIFWS